MYVQDREGLKQLVAELSGAACVAIDTEFMREKTYYPRLCLLQLASDTVVAAVDPLAIDDLSPLEPLMADAATTKVFHAGQQDIEILYRALGSTPAPVFDTQIAATLAGYPLQVGYGALVEGMLGITLDKSDTFTDWAARPLTAEQVDYALNDVRHLPDVYARLRDELAEKDRLAWLADDFERLADPATYEVVPEEQWRKVKRASTLDRRGLARLRELAAWREVEAQRRDLPRRWVLADESLVEIARRAPADRPALGAIRGIGERAVGRFGDALLRAVERGSGVPDEDLPRLPKRRRIAREAEQLADLMAVVVRVRAREHGVAPSLLAGKEDLARFAAGEESPLANGWRHALVGAELEALLAGHVALRVDDGAIAIEPYSDR
ncbi:MAG: ribonuclease D [Anaerosomatales bacterium]|nr:ribonuclease D [Anaerosomatales bacterium]